MRDASAITHDAITILKNLSTLDLMLEARRCREQADALKAAREQELLSKTRLLAAGIAVYSPPLYVVGPDPDLVREAKSRRAGG